MRPSRGRPVVWLLTLMIVSCVSADRLVDSSVDTRTFDGDYELDTLASLARMQTAMAGRAFPSESLRSVAMDAAARLERSMRDRYANFRISHGIIRAGTILVQEFSLQDATQAGDSLRGRAIWHEDVNDPGDASEELIALRLRGDTLEFIMHDDRGAALAPVRLIRRYRPT